MALFDKLYFTKRKLDADSCESRDRGRSSQIVPEQVRLLLFKECDWRGRKLLFDSSTIEKVPARKNDAPNVKQTSELPCILEVTDGFTYLYKGPAADANLLGEMIFGAVAMNYKGVSLKIHIMDDPRRLMCTKVFCVPSCRRINRADKKNGGASSSGYLHKGSKPLNVPLQRDEEVSLSFSLDRGDSGYYGDQSPYSSVSSTYEYFSMFDSDGNSTRDDLYTFHSPPGRNLSTSSNGSWQRRTFRNIATRFELGSTNLLNVPSTATSCSSQIYSNSSGSGTSDSLASTGSSVMTQRKNKLGLALLITVGDAAQMEVIRRCVEHSPQLQSLVCRLRAATVCAGGAGGAGGGFVATLHRAANDAARWLSDLMHGPRLQPTWLNLVTNESSVTNKMAETLLSDICSVLSVGDTKNTNFFISTLLTHVLTYHLGWVTTVSPYDTLDPQKHPTKEPRRPYNALWAQLNDLCGSIGFPPRAAKTIISGAKNTQFVNRLLAVLTYFVRCGDVTRNDFQPQECVLKESKVISVNKSGLGLKRTATQPSKLAEFNSMDCLKGPSINTNNSDSSASTLVTSEVSVKRTLMLANLSEKLSNSTELSEEELTVCDKPSTCNLRRSTTVQMLPLVPNSDSRESSLSDSEAEQKVVFVLGDDEKLVGLKNKSNGGKSVKKSSKIHNEPINLEVDEKKDISAKEDCEKKSCQRESCTRTTESPSRCCSQTLQHSKPIKHSGFKFEFDKYPQIVTNYMKSKNLEILDRHYIGKPGNLKLDNFQFDPTVVPPIQEEKCEACNKCQLLDSMLQTPTNASEFEYMNDVPRNSELQYAKETLIKEFDSDTSPKTFVRQRKKSTIVVNVIKCPEDVKSSVSVEVSRTEERRVERSRERDRDRLVDVKEVIEFPVRAVSRARLKSQRVGYDASLLGGITDHYVPDLVLQGTIAKPSTWENELRIDLELASCLNKSLDSPVQAVAIVGDTNTCDSVDALDRRARGDNRMREEVGSQLTNVEAITRQVQVLGGAGGCGMSALVGGMLDALPAMCHANVPAQQCLTFLESKLREFCVLSKTLADMLMSTDFCDIATLTKSLNIDINDVPLLLAVATTHTPQVATRYGISYR